MPVPPANQPPTEVLVYPLRFKRDYVIRKRWGLVAAILLFFLFIVILQVIRINVYADTYIVAQTTAFVNAMSGVFGYLILQMIYMIIVTVDWFSPCSAKEETQESQETQETQESQETQGNIVVQETSFIETPTGQGQRASVGVPYTSESVSPNPSEVVSSNPSGTANIIKVRETDVIFHRKDSSATVSSDSSATVSFLPPSETLVQIHREDLACGTDVTNSPVAASAGVSGQPDQRSDDALSAAGSARGEAKLDEIAERCRIEKSVVDSKKPFNIW